MLKIDDELYNNIFNDEDTTNSKKTLVKETEKVSFNSSSITANIYEWVNSIIIALVVIVTLLTFCFRLIKVDGISMEPTLINTDKVIVTNLFYTPNNGDIVVISHSGQHDSPLIKRVIATEGQQLKIDFETGDVFVDGKLLYEPYIQGSTIKGSAEIPEVIPQGKVFVMGDNRENSSDSRDSNIGLVDVENIIGKAQYVIVPHSYKGQVVENPPTDFSKIRYIYE